MSLFLKGPNDYERDLNVVRNYREHLACYASIMKDIPYEEALQKAVELSKPGGPLEPKDPELKVIFRKHAHADREKGKIKLSEFLRTVQQKNLVLSPSLIAYEDPKKERCYQGDFIDEGLSRRKKVKNKKFEAKMAGDEDMAGYWDKEQVNIKILNNSFSGAHCSPHNPNYAGSAHTSLTSTCRVATTNSNSSTERFMMGNRHYYMPSIALENAVAAIQLVDMELVKKAIETYGFKLPSIEYVLERFKNACDRYWMSTPEWNKLEAFLRKLNPVQLMVVIGVSDLKTWMDINPDFVRKMFDELTLFGFEDFPEMEIDEAKKWIKGADDYIDSLVASLSAQDLAGRSIGDLVEEDPKVYKRFAYRVKYITEAITGRYNLFFEAFMCTDLTPSSIHHFPTSVRECVIASDTDSTLFTTQSIIEWYLGELKFDFQADCARELMTYLNSQLVTHFLAKMSANIGTPEEHMFTLKMKPEFAMPVMGVTNRSKHYIATISACEGNVYPEEELETKGVALKSSKVPRWIIEIFNDYVTAIVETFKKGEKITPAQAISVPAYLEHKIQEDLRNGNSESLYNVRIKDASAYKNPESSILVYYDLWQEVFAPKYGAMPDPTVECKKIPVDLPNKTALAAWLDRIDPAVAGRMRGWLEKSGRTNFTMLLVSQEHLENNTIPDEIWEAVDIGKLLTDLTESFYYMLECLGIYYKNKHKTRFAYHDIDMQTAKDNLIIDFDKHFG